MIQITLFFFKGWMIKQKMFLYGKYIGLDWSYFPWMQNSGISHHPAHSPFLCLLVDLSKIFYKRSCLSSVNRCQVKLCDQLQCFQNKDCALASSPPDRRSGEVLKLISKLGTDSFNNLPKSSSKEGTNIPHGKKQQPEEQFSFMYFFLTIHLQ